MLLKFLFIRLPLPVFGGYVIELQLLDRTISMGFVNALPPKRVGFCSLPEMETIHTGR